MEHHELIIHPDWEKTTIHESVEEEITFCELQQQPLETDIYHIADEMILEMQSLSLAYPIALANGHLTDYMNRVHAMHIKWLQQLNRLSREEHSAETINPLVDALQAFTNKLNQSLTLLKPRPNKTH